MSKTWKKGGRTFDTDRYSSVYHVDEDRFCKSVWPEGPIIGPHAYNRSHIDLIIENHSNDANRNPFFTARTTLNKEKVKFTP